MTDPDRRVETALHEAAHAAVAFELRVRFKRVSIIPDGETLGRVTLPVYWSGSKRRPSPLASVVVDLVGELVARQFRIVDQGHGEYVPDPDLHAIGAGSWMSGGTKDLLDAEREARIATWSPLEAATFLEWAHARTVTVASKFEFRRRMEALVPMLLERQELRGREARSIIRRAWPRSGSAPGSSCGRSAAAGVCCGLARYVWWRSCRAVRTLRALLTQEGQCKEGAKHERARSRPAREYHRGSPPLQGRWNLPLSPTRSPTSNGLFLKRPERIMDRLS